MRWQIANEARSTELAIIISYPTSASGIALSNDSVFNEKNYTDQGESTVVRRVLVDVHNST